MTGGAVFTYTVSDGAEILLADGPLTEDITVEVSLHMLYPSAANA